MKFTTFLIPLLLLTSCGQKTQFVYEEKHTFTSFWGTEFKSTPIADYKDVKIRKPGEAVGYITSLAGRAGTGFFISADGLFLTNHHVIPKSECSKDHCHSIKIIREFSPEGANQVFTDLKIIASNPDLDYTLLKVNLLPGKQVPFISIADPKLKSKSITEMKDNLRVLGHPFNAPLRVAEVGPAVYEEGNTIIAQANLVYGNSGGPMIDTESMHAVALVNAINSIQATINVKGDGYNLSYAINIKSIFINLENHFNFAYTKENGIQILANKDSLEWDFMPQDRDKLKEENKVSFTAWVGSFYQTDQSEQYFSKVIKKVLHDSNKSSVEKTEILTSFINNIINFEHKTGEMIIISDQDLKKIEQAIVQVDDKDGNLALLTMTPLRFTRGKISTSACLKDVELFVKDRGYLEIFKYNSVFCNSLVDIDGDDMLDQVMEFWANHKPAINHDINFLLLEVISKVLNLRKSITPQQKEFLLTVIQESLAKEENFKNHCYIHNLKVRIQTNY